MPYSLDPQVAAGLAALAGPDGPVPPLAVGDVAGRRAAVREVQTVAHALLPTPADVTVTDFTTTTTDGAELLLRWYAKEGSSPGSAVLYAHGGGMIASTVALYDGPVARYVSATGVPFLSVEYRCAPEHPAPVPVTDCFTGLQWLVAHAGDLGVDPARIAVMGDSGGGGIAASLAIRAREAGGPAVAAQILVYPMLDDRTTRPDPALVPFLTWTYEDNITAWDALLGDAAGGPEVHPYAAAARLTDFGGLPPAYIEVGELDIFRDEDLAYAQRLIAAGVSVEFHLHPHIPHAAEALAPHTDIARRVAADRHRVITAL